MNLLKENTGELLQNIGTSKDLLEETTKAQ
jgi:hypothetical protein